MRYISHRYRDIGQIFKENYMIFCVLCYSPWSDVRMVMWRFHTPSDGIGCCTFSSSLSASANDGVSVCGIPDASCICDAYAFSSAVISSNWPTKSMMRHKSCCMRSTCCVSNFKADNFAKCAISSADTCVVWGLDVSFFCADILLYIREINLLYLSCSIAFFVTKSTARSCW